MRNKLTKPGRIFALQQTALIISLTLIITLLIGYIWGGDFAKSSLLGGLVAILPNILFAYKAFKYAGATASKKVVDSFFSGVKQKMILMAILLGLVLKFIVIIPIPFFGMFCLVMAMPLITPLVIKQKR